jgi:hypothetical protein
LLALGRRDGARVFAQHEVGDLGDVSELVDRLMERRLFLRKAQAAIR